MSACASCGHDLTGQFCWHAPYGQPAFSPDGRRSSFMRWPTASPPQDDALRARFDALYKAAEAAHALLQQTKPRSAKTKALARVLAEVKL